MSFNAAHDAQERDAVEQLRFYVRSLGIDPDRAHEEAEARRVAIEAGIAIVVRTPEQLETPAETVARLTRERDEARADYDDALRATEAALRTAAVAERERDEARAEAERLLGRRACSCPHPPVAHGARGCGLCPCDGTAPELVTRDEYARVSAQYDEACECEGAESEARARLVDALECAAAVALAALAPIDAAEQRPATVAPTDPAEIPAWLARELATLAGWYATHSAEIGGLEFDRVRLLHALASAAPWLEQSFGAQDLLDVARDVAGEEWVRLREDQG